VSSSQRPFPRKEAAASARVRAVDGLGLVHDRGAGVDGGRAFVALARVRRQAVFSDFPFSRALGFAFARTAKRGGGQPRTRGREPARGF